MSILLPLLITLCSLQQYAIAENSISTSITKERAEAIVWELPEIKAWKKYIDKKNKGTVHAATMVLPETPLIIKGKQYWAVNFYEDRPAYLHRWQTFMIPLDSKKILVDTDTTGIYSSLQEWRTKTNPMERIRESKTP